MPKPVWMTPEQFVTFKNTGKRKGSNKVSPMRDASGKRAFYSRERENRTGTKSITDKNYPGGQREVYSQPLRMFDVGKYERVKGVEYDGKARVERDHVPSGESLHRKANDKPRDGNKKGRSYWGGHTITIGAKDHKDFSPTLGGRNEALIDKDANDPGAAVRRDIDTMLEKKTRNPLNTEAMRSKRPGMMGAYRFLYKSNVKGGTISGESDADRMTMDHVRADLNEKIGGNKSDFKKAPRKERARAKHDRLSLRK